MLSQWQTYLHTVKELGSQPETCSDRHCRTWIYDSCAPYHPYADKVARPAHRCHKCRMAYCVDWSPKGIR